MTLQFDQLRVANTKRLPLFTNKHGEPAHHKQDGSDWDPAMWLQALFGELGEYAQVRTAYEEGRMSYEEYCIQAAKEIADVQGYLDLLAKRSLDKVPTMGLKSPAQRLQSLIAWLGDYANTRKKLDRGDMDVREYKQMTEPSLDAAEDCLRRLRSASQYGSPIIESEPHPEGVNLGEATRAKFNEVSKRVKCKVTL